MNKYLICQLDGRTHTVYAASLTSAGESFPRANVYQVSNLSRRLVRYIPQCPVVDPVDGPLLRMAVEGMTSHHPDRDGAGYQCNRNMLLQDVYDTCEKILLEADKAIANADAVDVDLALDLALHGRKYVVQKLADREDVPFDLLWAVWLRMQQKTNL